MELFHRQVALSVVHPCGELTLSPGPAVLTQTNFPNDMDTTSLGTTIMKRPADVANLVMDEMLLYRTADGLMQVRECTVPGTTTWGQS